MKQNCKIKNTSATEKNLLDLGWVLSKEYSHDQFNTNRYQLGCMEVEFTYEKEKLITCDVVIELTNPKEVSLEEIKMLTLILGKANV